MLSWSSDSLVDILSDNSVSIVVRMDAIIHKLRAAQVISSKGLKVVDDLIITKSQLFGDLWNQIWKSIIDNRLLKMAGLGTEVKV